MSFLNSLKIERVILMMINRHMGLMDHAAKIERAVLTVRYQFPHFLGRVGADF